jgi:hypothetical protein
MDRLNYKQFKMRKCCCCCCRTVRRQQLASFWMKWRWALRMSWSSRSSCARWKVGLISMWKPSATCGRLRKNWVAVSVYEQRVIHWSVATSKNVSWRTWVISRHCFVRTCIWEGFSNNPTCGIISSSDYVFIPGFCLGKVLDKVNSPPQEGQSCWLDRINRRRISSSRFI